MFVLLCRLFFHRQRAFRTKGDRDWETEVRSVVFENGLLTISLAKVVPDHHARRDFDL